MSWQEELRRLDEELASGRLSADDYRIRRDQVLSSAVGQQDPPPPQQANTSADSTQVIAPVSPPHGVPQQPAQQPPAPQPPADQGAERTQAVSWQQQQQQQQTPHADVNRTEYVQPQQQPPQPQYSPAGGFPQATPQSPPAGFPQAQQAPWNAPEGDQSPPWGGGNDLGAVGGSESNWSTGQGPEFFSEKPKKGNGKKVGAIVGAVVVLAAIAFGAYWLWGRGPSSSGQQTAGPTQQASSSAPKPPDPMALGAMPGQAETHDDITSFSQVDGLKYLNPQELSAYQSAGATKVKFVVYHLDNGDHITLFLAQASSATAAKTAAEKLEQVQVTNGAKRDSTAPDGVYATTIDQKDGQSAQVRGHYAHGKVIVRVEASGPGSLSQAKTDFTSALNAQLTALPANG